METTTPSINRIKTAELLRTKGAVTGNFGKAKVKGGSTLNDLGVSSREHIGNLPTQDEYIRRLQEALGKDPEPKVRNFIESELRKHSLRSISHDRRVYNPLGPYCDLSQRNIAASR
jgi:hypothetical protein